MPITPESIIFEIIYLIHTFMDLSGIINFVDACIDARILQDVLAFRKVRVCSVKNNTALYL